MRCVLVVEYESDPKFYCTSTCSAVRCELDQLQMGQSPGFSKLDIAQKLSEFEIRQHDLPSLQ
jgi:hypothetical protein